MRITGVLTYDRTLGLVLQNDGSMRSILWPFGWSAHREVDGIVLLNRSGQIVAWKGEEVLLAGGKTRDYDYVCDDVFLG